MNRAAYWVVATASRFMTAAAVLILLAVGAFVVYYAFIETAEPGCPFTVEEIYQDLRRDMDPLYSDDDVREMAEGMRDLACLLREHYPAPAQERDPIYEELDHCGQMWLDHLALSEQEPTVDDSDPYSPEHLEDVDAWNAWNQQQWDSFNRFNEEC